MTRRTRSLLLDNSGGRMFTNVTSSVEATADKVIAGSRPQVKSLNQSAKRNAYPTMNLAGTVRGVVLSQGAASLSRVDITLSVAPVGGTGLTIRLRAGTTNASANSFAEIVVPSGQLQVSQLLTQSIPAGHGIFVDVLTVGSAVRGQGLSISFTYFVS